MKIRKEERGEMVKNIMLIVMSIVIIGLGIFSGIQSYRLGQYRIIVDEATERSREYAEQLDIVRSNISTVTGLISSDIDTVSDVIEQIRAAREVFEAMESCLDSLGINYTNFVGDDDSVDKE